jgi:serine/threonine-protein kinase
LDGRSDLFALGVTMYQLLTGVLPFRADSMTRLMHTIATEPHPSMRSIRPELPAGLDDVMDRALAKSAEDRFQNGATMAEAIRTCMRTIAP